MNFRLLGIMGAMALVLVGRAGTGAEAWSIERIEAKVTKHVQSYYLTRPVGGITAKAVDVLVDITITKPVDDRPGRYVTTGRATVVFLNDATPNYAAEFTVVSQVDEDNALRIVDTQSRRATY